MINNNILNNLGVLVTRPLHQSQELCRLIQSNGGCPILFPAIAIEPINNPELVQKLFSKSWNIVIYTSPNAVQFAANLNFTVQANSIVAIGTATANTLNKVLNCKSNFIPERQDSEGLLNLPILMQPKDQTILIVRGIGGRTLLNETLTARGALVSIAEVYQRSLPKFNVEPMVARWKQEIQIVIATSGEILDNLLLLVGSNGRSKLLNTPLITISERLCYYAKELGFINIMRSPNASDESLLKTLIDFVHNLCHTF